MITEADLLAKVPRGLYIDGGHVTLNSCEIYGSEARYVNTAKPRTHYIK